MSENAQRGPTAERGPIRDGRTAPFMLINMRYMYGPLTTIPGVPERRACRQEYFQPLDEVTSEQT